MTTRLTTPEMRAERAWEDRDQGVSIDDLIAEEIRAALVELVEATKLSFQEHVEKKLSQFDKHTIDHDFPQYGPLFARDFMLELLGALKEIVNEVLPEEERIK